ncbi:MAG TPA: helix-turn-helix domain-containing protein [Roseovarius sp.]
MEKPFQKERLTFRLDMLAKDSINANDDIFAAILGLKIRDIRALRIINDHAGITFVELVRLADLERSRTSRIIQSLIKKGFVRRENDDEDARKFRLYTTEAGALKRAEADTLSDDLEQILVAPLEPSEVEALDRLLTRLAIWIRSDEYKERLKEYSARIAAVR